MDIMLATTVYDEELKSWIVYVDSEGELVPVGETINEDLGLFEYCKFNTKEEAIDWINSKPNKMKYDKDLMKNIFQCDECKSENLELIKRETKQKWDNYYMEMEYFDVLTFKCKDCGCETVECP